MMGRYVISIVIGSLVTVSLLFIMQLLIVTGKQALTDPRMRHKLEFVRVKRNENLNIEDIVPEKPPKPPETPPEAPPQEAPTRAAPTRRHPGADRARSRTGRAQVPS